MNHSRTGIFLTTAVILLTFTNSSMCWIQKYGTHLETAAAVLQLPGGDLLFTGSTGTYGAGNFDVFLVRTDASGNELWHKTFGTANLELGVDIKPTSDGGFIICGDQYNTTNTATLVQLIKTDSAGNLSWTRNYNFSGFTYPYSIVQTSDGGYIVSGSTAASFFSPRSGLIFRTDSLGNMLWSKTIFNSGFDDAATIIPTSDGNFVVTGTNNISSTFYVFLLKMDINGNYLWYKNYTTLPYSQSAGVTEITGGDFIITGNGKSNISDPKNQMFLIKTDINGNPVWTKTYVNTYGSSGYSVLQAADGNITVAGKTGSAVGDSNISFYRTDTDGNQLYYQEFGDPVAQDYAYDLVQTSDSGYIICGKVDYYSNTLQGVAALIKINPGCVPDTPTISPTHTVSPTSSVPPTITLTSTITLTYTISPTFTLTETSTATPTVTHTATFTSTPSITMTASFTATFTQTHTITLTVPFTPTVTPYIADDIIVYPNPYSLSVGTMKFAGMPPDSRVLIYSISGEHVISVSADNGVALWAGNNSYGRRVSQSIYFYTIELPENRILSKGKLYVTR